MKIIIVAPYVGAWIETCEIKTCMSRHIVAPYVGAWIETDPIRLNRLIATVAPYVGAWIETSIPLNPKHIHIRRSLRGSVD